jgi:molecular chaperone DnaK
MKSTPAVGIDLGTTFSLVAYLDSAGRPWTIPNAEGDMLTPSVVLFEGSSVVVGKEAVKAAAMEPERIAQFAKRDMGSSVYSKAINGEHLPPEVIQSLILEKLKRDAEAKLGPFTKAVITVPAYFNEPRRKATQDAGHLAGLEVLDIINEPTAAAIAFGVEQGFLTPKGESTRAERILVYDLGGGTFDVTLMDIDGKNCTVLATAGDVYLGGIDWDQRIVGFVAEQFQKKFRAIDPRQNPAGHQRLLREAEDAKRALTARETTTISFEYAGHGMRVPVSRHQFEAMTSDLLERTRFTTRNLLKEAGLGWDAITRLLLVGGSSRMPMVQNMLEQEAGRKVDRSLSFDEAVAHGAAIYAGLMYGRARPWPWAFPSSAPARAGRGPGATRSRHDSPSRARSRRDRPCQRWRNSLAWKSEAGSERRHSGMHWVGTLSPRQAPEPIRARSPPRQARRSHPPQAAGSRGARSSRGSLAWPSIP